MLKKLKDDKALVQVFVYILLVAVFLIQNNINIGGYEIHSRLDDYIPFIPAFIIPYTLWYFLIASAAVVFFFRSKKDLEKIFLSLNICMGVSLLVYFLFPNYISLRPVEYGTDIFSQGVKLLQLMDSSSSVCPSLHVSISFAVYAGISHSNLFRHKHTLKALMFLSAIIISASTVFIKQHSIIDVFFGILLSIFSTVMVYKPAFIFTENVENNIENKVKG